MTNSTEPSESHKAFRARLRDSFQRVLPEASAELASGALTPERSQQIIDAAGALMLPDLEAAVSELRSALLAEVPPRVVNPWSRAAEALESLIVATVGFRSLGLPVARPIANRVLGRLHGRAVVTAWEVNTLVRASLPAGANARWRSLHEIAVASVLIAEFGDAIAERYEDHEPVRAHRVFKQLREHGEHWELIPIPEEAFARIENKYRRALTRYGDAFRDDYEWARPALPDKKGRIQFSDLETAVGAAPWRMGYVMASEHIHVGDSGGSLVDDHGSDNPYLLPRWTTSSHGLAGGKAGMSLVSATRALVIGSLGPEDENRPVVDFLLASLESLRRRVDSEFEVVEQALFARSFPQKSN